MDNLGKFNGVQKGKIILRYFCTSAKLNAECMAVFLIHCPTEENYKCTNEQIITLQKS